MSLLGNGTLLILRDAGDAHPLRLTAAVLTGLLAAMCGLLARTRARALADHRERAHLHPPTAAVRLLALGVTVVCVLELVAISRAGGPRRPRAGAWRSDSSNRANRSCGASTTTSRAAIV